MIELKNLSCTSIVSYISPVIIMKKQIYVDYLRVIATFAVIVWHCTSNIYYQFGPIEEWMPASITFGPLVRWSVPVFIMISGALLLGKEEDPMTFYKKRFTRILIPAAIWILIYGSIKYLHFILPYPSVPNIFKKVILESFGLFFTNQLSYHFYFVSLILGLYLLCPFISRMVRGLSKSQLELFLLIGITLLSVRVFYQNLFLVDNFQLGGNLIFFVLGYYLHTYPPTPKFRWTLYISAIVLAILSVWLTYRKEYVGMAHDDTFYKTHGIFVFVFSSAVYVLIHQLFSTGIEEKPDGKFRKLILFISSNSYGFFLAHPLIINILLFSKSRFYTLTTSNFTLHLGGKDIGFTMNNQVGAYFLATLVFFILCICFYVARKIKLTKYLT
ncbi:acyltransferase [Pseudoflavitalea sp. G-6-1-2]|uniref:acyltransferase n=1 Tax=Pseudoflavitalea sp. G-6-1-2 TaxID=2728841 RepID=UPI001469ECAF|nr:acyltransferase [Pseudoflavitalea sp. G-6-1-2]NML19640.1 acyltransferase [Pseudoflavitalea sp. G-6-1-2]